MIMILSIFFSTGVFAANELADKTATAEIGVAYRGHIQNQGNMPKPEGNLVMGPEALGTRGQSLRTEGFWIALTGNVPEEANIVYEVHVQNEGWMTPVKNGNFAGTTGKSQRVESIKIRLENLPDYDVYYRGHVQNMGNIPQVDGDWGWVKNGEELGTTGSSLRLEELQVKIVKKATPTTIYNKAGIFGPETGVEIVEDNVSINTPDVTLQNLHIKGNLTIGEGVGEGDVTLNNITVDGDTFIRGGGKNSIHINGGDYNKITILQTSSGQVRIVATNAAGLEVVVSEDAKGEDIILEGAFENVKIDAPDVKISTQGETTIKDMVVAENAKGSEITLDKKTTVNNIELNTGVDMKGEGTIEKANVNSDDVTFEQAPKEEVVAPEVTVPPVVTPPAPPKPSPTPIAIPTVASIEIQTNPSQTTSIDNSGSVIVNLTTTTSDTEIYYTLDGSNPTSDSIRYTVSFNITASKREGETISVKAIGIKAGYHNADVKEKQIIFNAAVVKNVSYDKLTAIVDGGGKEAQLTDGKFSLSVEKHVSISQITIEASDFVTVESGAQLMLTSHGYTSYFGALELVNPTEINGKMYSKILKIAAYHESILDDYLFSIPQNSVQGIDGSKPLLDFELSVTPFNGPTPKDLSVTLNDGTKIESDGKSGILFLERYCTIKNALVEMDQEVVLNENPVVRLKLDNVEFDYGKIEYADASHTKLLITPLSDEIAMVDKLGYFAFSVPENAITDLDGNSLSGIHGNYLDLFLVEVTDSIHPYIKSISAKVEGKTIEAVQNSDGIFGIDVLENSKTSQIRVQMNEPVSVDEELKILIPGTNTSYGTIEVDQNDRSAVIIKPSSEAIGTAGKVGLITFDIPADLVKDIVDNSSSNILGPSSIAFRGGGLGNEKTRFNLNVIGSDTPTPSDPSAEDLIVAEFNNANNNVAILELVMKNALKLNLTGFEKLDYMGKSIVSQSLLEKDDFANKSAIQAALTEGIKRAQDDVQANEYMKALFSYTPNLSLEDNTCTVTYPDQLTEIQKNLLSGLYADLVIKIDTPLSDGEVLELTVAGATKQVSNKDFAGKEILLSKLLGRKLVDCDLVQNQNSTIIITVKDISTKIERYVTVCPCTSKNGEEYFKNFTNAYALKLLPFWLDAYSNMITVDYQNSEFLFNYAGNLTEVQKQGLAGYYTDTVIHINRALEADESITISGLGKEMSLTSSTVMENAEKTEIRLSKLMNVVLGPDNLAANQQGDQKISLKDIKLNSTNYIWAEAILAKGNAEIIDTGKANGTSLYPTWMEDYMNTVSVSADDSKIIVSYDGNLSESDKTGLKGYQADVLLYLTRDLEENETITVSALGKTTILTKEKMNNQTQIKLSELMGITQEAASKFGDDQIICSPEGLNRNIGVYANPILVKNDDECVYLHNGISLSLYQPSFKAYEDSIELRTEGNKFLVNYSGILSPGDQEKLNDYYSDAEIYLDRALEENETVTVNAFGQDVIITNITTAEDVDKRCYRLSKLLGIELGETNLAVNQEGSFAIAIEDNTLEKQLNVSARAILVKNSDIEYLDKYTGMSINPKGFDAYDDSVEILTNSSEGFSITHKGGLSPDDISNLAGLYGDTEISLDRSLETGESIKVSAYGKEAVITKSTFTVSAGNRIGLTELLGISPDNAPLATNQTANVQISFTEKNLESPIGVAAWKGLLKGDGTWVYRDNNGIGFSLYPLFMEAYQNNLTLTTGENKISVTYAEQLSNEVKAALEGYYSDAMIYLSRPLVAGEEVMINAFGNNLTVDSSLVTESDGTQIRLSQLLGLTLGNDQLAANQSGGFDLTVMDNSLKSDLTISADAILVKGGEIQFINKGVGLRLTSHIFENAIAAYRDALTVSVNDNAFNVVYAGNLSEETKIGLNGFYSDAMIYLSRPLVAGEEILINAFGNNVTVNSSMLSEPDGTQIRLSQLLGLTLGNDQLAANQSGGFDIMVTDKSLKTDITITSDAILVKVDEMWYLDKMEAIQVKSQAFEKAVAAYTEAFKVRAEVNTFYVSYAGNLSEEAKAGLNGYHSDAWICLSRPMEENEEVTVNAFGDSIEVNRSSFTDEMGQYINLSDLLGSELGEDQLAANQTGTFEIKVTDKSLKTEMIVTAYACLRKGDDRQVLESRHAYIVIGGPIALQSISITTENDVDTVAKGSALQLIALADPINAADQSIVWKVESENSEVDIEELAAIEPSSGLLTAKGAGKVIVTAVNELTGISGSKTIEITEE
ncbi:hypothetical protein AKG39_12785 [Acetobacterium bakii]|uniref:Uncharacterized protein n=2 Tax=Acetobacterium bakii TaxID=52689 RepID=A0A0L6TY57_9FIRM|nr:FN3 associated domain-containing protein [Acetobacterium bakii]KNZ41196.1 hypothetical protein AKG39_12785 [Acetobacterium bakii]